MSSQIYSSMPPSSTHQSMSNHNRPIANFHPCVWGNIFLSCPSKTDFSDIPQKHGELKEEVRRMVKEAMHDELLHKLRLIDTIERLGVSYHFEREIEKALHNIFEQDWELDQTHLEVTSLRFRLLRENGFNVPSEIFNKFKDGEGNFKNSLTSDVKGLLELYEAAHLRVHGEDILEEALVFTISHLQSAKAAGSIEYPLSALVSNALNRPISKCLPRLEARRFIPIYQQDASHDKTLLKFAELDFNLWWKDLDVETKLPFIRNRSVEGYFWILGVYFEPQYSYAREILTKILLMISIMDDIYDAYGTYEELELLTIAIQRWDADCLDQLPEYMKFFYKPMLDFYGELEEAMAKQGKSYRFQYAKDTFKQLSESYFVENKWYQEKYVPTMEEYMRNALVTAGYVLLTIASFIGMEDSVTPEIFKWAFSNPKIVSASSVVCRLMDDIASHKFEQERGHVQSAVECYMRQHGVSEEEACSELKKQVENAWKDINYEIIFSETTKVIPMPVLRRSLNLTRVIEFLYKDGDDQYTHVGKVTKDGVASLLIDPVSVSP
ncbi:(+)-delta-cadinene synthase isozyme XC14 [Hibiscus syriacus]|uniref:(+)-delta-cadinene synthase n=1 Tax=Hibiscus syriacus TaxID=106335 RepID=A0A6A2XG39_HIBSY|nr:(+)-delta-cadinene synthase isozyme XC14 [Hibiscus syriacus]